jgi:hypothetical protein
MGDDMKLKKIGAALMGTLALVFSLVACAGPSTVDPQKLVSNFVGTWEMYSATFEDGPVTNEDYQELTGYGMHTTLDLDDDGGLLIDAFGNQYFGTWKIKDERTLSLTIDGDSVDAPFEGGMLSISYDGESMVFEKTDATPNMDRDPSENAGDFSGFEDTEETTSTTDGTSDFFSAETDFYVNSYVSDVTEDSPLNVVVADDENLSITVYAVGTDYEGDTGYLMTVENKTDEDLVVLGTSFTVNGVSVSDDYATLARPVPAGQTRKAFLFFDQDVATVSEGSTCTGMIGAFDASDNNAGIYDLSI